MTIIMFQVKYKKDVAKYKKDVAKYKKDVASDINYLMPGVIQIKSQSNLVH